MKQKISLLLGFIFIIGVTVYFSKSVSVNEERLMETVIIDLDEEQQLVIEAEHLELRKASDLTEEQIGSVDRIHIFDIWDGSEKAGEVTITVRTIDNGDLFVFSKLVNDREDVVVIDQTLTYPNVNRYVLTDFDQRFKEREHNPTLGVDPTTYPIGLVELYSFEDLAHNLFLSKNYLSQEMVLDYENSGISVLRELVDEVKSFSIGVGVDDITVSLPLHSFGEDISENWMMLSGEVLFEDREVLDRWIDYNIESYSQVNKWFTAGGPYKKLPWSIEPFTKMGYGRNLGSMQDKKALDKLEDYGERFFYNLTMNSVANLLGYREEGQVVWETEYTSTWLKQTFESIAPFVDTRHNENIAIFLTRTGHLLDIEELKDAHVDYADYLLEQVEKENIFYVDKGFYIADYYSPHPGTKMTHASLNHIVGGINFLLDSYISTGEEKYLDVAKQVRLAIEETGEEWIRDTGDLWYQINPDLTFAGNDYEQLTLIDLLTSQVNWEEAGEERSELFDVLISSKTEYLVTNEKQIFDYVLDMLVEQGFRELVKGRLS